MAATGAQQRLDLVSSRAVLGALESLHAGILLLDRGGEILWLSESVRRLAGVHGESLCTWMDLLADSADAAALKAELLARGRVPGRPVRLRLAGGRVLTVTVRILRVSAGEGAPPHVLALIDPLAAHDDDSRATACAPSNTVDSLGAWLDGSPEAALALGQAGRAVYANAALERLLGCERNAILGRSLDELFAGAEGVGAFARALGRGKPSFFAQHLALRCDDGSPRWLHVTVNPIRPPDARLAANIIVLRDVTNERREAADLARKNAALESYVHSVSHDLRSPLVSLLGFVRLLREDHGDVLGEQGRHFLDRVDQAGRTMESLIRDLLPPSRIGGASEHTAFVDPLPILSQLRAELSPRLEAQHVTLTLPESVPFVRCDRTRLYQVFSNLVGNALDHMGSREDACIEIDVCDAGNVHLLSVHDNGRGIDPSLHERIFEIFQSLDPRSEGRANAGVGLAIVKKIAEAYEGAAWVESTPGTGATFFVSLPHP